MIRRIHILAAAMLLISLLTGTVVSGAQAPLTESYTWEPHNVSIRYPGDWSVIQKEAAISLRPIGLDVSDGHGPELVLFDVPGARADQLDSALTSIAGGSGATTSVPASGSLNSHPTASVSMRWSDPAAGGVMTLIALGDQTVIGVAYVVRSADAPAFLPVLEAIQASLAFDSLTAALERSVSVTSVQLPQRYLWQSTGLVLYLPANWRVDLDRGLDDETLVATPDPGTVSGDARYHIIQAATLDGIAGVDLQAVAAASALDYPVISEIVAISVGGLDGVIYEIHDESSNPPLHLRPLMLALPDGEMALLIFGTREAAWESFRPVVSAMISSIEMDRTTSQLVPGDSGAERALLARAPQAATIPWRQESPDEFVWEEYGIGFSLPEGWQTFPGDGQEYDLALVSSAAVQSQQGAFITLRGFSGLLTGDVTLESALQPIADNVEAEVEDYTTGGMDGKAVHYATEEEGARRSFILLPYGTRGDAIYIQSTAPADDDSQEVIQGILDSMTVNPPEPDYAAADAAWQTSLAEQGKLIVGDPDAPVKMIEYLSFTCGHCVHYSRSIERLIALEVETGRVQYEFAALAGDPLASNAAHATYCAAEQGKGFTVAETLFQGYLDLGPEAAYSLDGINDLLGDLGLDMDALSQCISDATYGEALNQVRSDFNDKGLTGTPTMAMGKGDDPPEPLLLPNGQVWAGAIPLHFVRDIVKAVIEDDIEIAEYFDQ